MYHVSTVGFSRSLCTLLDVLWLFRNDAHFAHLEVADVSLSHADQPLRVTKFNGQLTVRVSGAMRDIFLALIDEIDGQYFRPYGSQLQPWQIRRPHWKLLYFAFELSTEPLYLFSSDQVCDSADAQMAGRTPSLSETCQAEALARFGFGAAGPVYGDSGQHNSRHEVHLAYALAAGLPVPLDVLSDYTAEMQQKLVDIPWAIPLLEVPELRGAVPVAKLRPLASVVRHSGKKITSENAALLAMVTRLLPNEPTTVQVDDLLYRHGLLDAQPLPDAYSKPVDIGEPVSAFAVVIRRVMADERRDATFSRLDLERADGRISQRYYELHRAVAALDHGRGTFQYANDFARALENGDMQMLLDIVDRPDDQNRWTKMAIREHFGVKLIGLKAAARRRAIFALAGMSESQQSQWEEGTKQSRAAASMERKADRAKARAATARYRDGAQVISGAQHVESSIASGFTEIGRFWQGASCRYYLKNAQVQGALRYLRAGDGTLAYAQSLLSKQSQHSA